MTTIPLLKSEPARRVARQSLPQRRPGRPPEPTRGCAVLQIPHPIHAHLIEMPITEAQAMRWTGRSRQTVRRWVALGQCPDVGLARLLALYAHGMMPIRPEHYQHPDAAEWALMRFRLDEQRPLRRKTTNPADRHPLALLTYHGGQALNWVQVDAVGLMLARQEETDNALGRWKARALAAESEAARLRELVAYQ